LFGASKTPKIGTRGAGDSDGKRKVLAQVDSAKKLKFAPIVGREDGSRRSLDFARLVVILA
jgi:hypothetical protein